MKIRVIRDDGTERVLDAVGVKITALHEGCVYVDLPGGDGWVTGVRVEIES